MTTPQRPKTYRAADGTILIDRRSVARRPESDDRYGVQQRDSVASLVVAVALTCGLLGWVWFLVYANKDAHSVPLNEATYAAPHNRAH